MEEPAFLVTPHKLSHRLDERVVEQLVTGYRAGASSRQLAAQFDLSKASVIAVLREHGIPIRFPRLSPEETQKIVGLYRGGMAQVDIARRFERNPSLVWHVLQRTGLVGRR